MNDYNDKRAIPLTQYTYKEIEKNLCQWRNIIREELECLIYIKNNLQLTQYNSISQLTSSSSSINSLNYQEKITNLIPKLENSCLKQIECINDFLTDIQKKTYKENSEQIYSKVEAIRDNHNKLLVNIQKMLINVPIFQQYVLKYKETISKGTYDEQVIQTTSYEKDQNDNVQYNMIEYNESSIEENKKIENNNNSNRKHNYNIRNIKKPQKDFNKEFLGKLNKEIEDIHTMSAINSNHKMKRHFNDNYSEYQQNFNKSKNNNHISKNKSQYIVTTITQSNKPNFNGSLSKNNSNNSFNHVKSNSNICQKRNNGHNNSKSKSPCNKSNDKIIEQFKEEIKHIRSYCENLEKEFKKHCLISNEKKEFDNLKKENIKLIADVKILKEDVMDLLKQYQTISTKINQLENENEQLKHQNKTLLNFITNKASSNNNNNITNSNNNNLSNLVFNNSLLQTQQLLPNQSNSHNNNSQYQLINNNLENLNKVMNEQLSEFSAFNLNNSNNNSINKSNIQNAYPNMQNELQSNSNTIHSNFSNNNNISATHSKTSSNVTNLAALTQINQSIVSRDRSITPIKNKKRYLIPKSGE